MRARASKLFRASSVVVAALAPLALPDVDASAQVTSVVQSRAPLATSATPAHTVPLTAVHSTLKLAALPVQDVSGQQFGLIQNVQTGADGRPASIEVALNMPPGKTATIPAAKVRYDQANNLVVAELTPSEIASLSHAGAGGDETVGRH